MEELAQRPLTSSGPVEKSQVEEGGKASPDSKPATEGSISTSEEVCVCVCVPGWVGVQPICTQFVSPTVVAFMHTTLCCRWNDSRRRCLS